ncbi:hypothetical protein CSCING10_012580 [[Clostridium] scindens]|uniref:Uncharacterized protein n=1 Tax=Clostridium scindens (strain ATCC 35704 / DSM 5676 / VPI 13733 / 19) TaxID=411468 RepID=A0A494WME5_CLOS5|nr:hypothetical protein HMPREF0993_02398 [Lachnospiraceae bacterium 5_1_57FAA]QBF75224.1 hypothetical protein HDCHBGLK_02633 [[Clostridium] scindens ATCC 35704]WPB21229.1 hypothetical protein GAFPHCNK_00670 [[Clostridium] scindens]WPB40086.1 hypothetical protein DEGADCKI_01405 [[Clostridium] scindens]BCZ30064.1 hypothetical protein CSCING10_012580 [[Clostridium] scindens]
MPIKIPSSFGLIAFFSIIIDGMDNVVTPIIKARTTPRFAPFAKSASAIGIVPKMSAYIGIPTMVAIITPKGLPVPRILTIKSSGIQLWINAPIQKSENNRFSRADLESKLLMVDDDMDMSAFVYEA